MNNLPELPLEKIFGYLSLEERIKAMAVSRSWYKMINSFRPASLFFSDRPSGFIDGKIRLIDGAFVRNFISSNRFEKFFNAFGQSILSNLKHLRLCDLELNAGIRRAFSRTLNSFDQLEELGLFRLKPQGDSELKIRLKLNLPMLNSIHLEDLTVINLLTLDTPKLKNVKLWNSPDLKLDIIHGEAVEKLTVFETEPVQVKEMKNLKNLKYLYVSGLSISSTLLSGLEQLKEIHLDDYHDIKKLFDQKQRYGLAELKVFLCGMALEGPNDPVIDSIYASFNEATLRCFTKNASRLANEISFFAEDSVLYDLIEAVPGSEVGLLNRLTNLKSITVSEQVQDVERFLNFLKNSKSISDLDFDVETQPQTLFDRLPGHCTIQRLWISLIPDKFDWNFLFRLKNLIDLRIDQKIDIQTIRQVLEDLPFLCILKIPGPYVYYMFTWVEIDQHPKKRFKICDGENSTTVFDVDAAIRFISNPGQAKKRKAEATDRPAKSMKLSR